MDAYQSVINSLNQYIKKHHTNQLIKGTFLLLALVLLAFLLLVTAEYFGGFSAKIRTILAISFLCFVAFLLARFIIRPLIFLLQIRPGMDHKTAARIIGQHFPMVSDKILNIIELKEISSKEGNELVGLIEAGIEQKAEEIKPVPVLSAINFAENKKYIKYVGIPLLIIATCFVVIPEFISGPSKRMVAFTEEFVPEAPFQLVFNQTTFTIAKGDDLNFSCSLVNSNILPSSVFASFGEYKERLTKKDNDYTIAFKHVQEDFSFTVEADGFTFATIEVIVKALPELSQFTLRVVPPAYTGLLEKTYNTTGDAVVPSGSLLKWELINNNADSVNLYGISQLVTKSFSREKTRSEALITQDLKYGIYRKNAFTTIIDSNTYQIKVIEDAYPSIDATLAIDSVLYEDAIVNTSISDDYGISSLYFYYKGANKNEKFERTKIEFSPELKDQKIQQYLNLKELRIPVGEEIRYYLEVADNDKPNGFKTSKTNENTLRIKTEKELAEDRNKALESGKNSLESITKSTEELNESVKDLKNELLNKDKSDLNDKRKIQSLLEQKKALEKKLEELNREMDKSSKIQEKINEENLKQLEKQEQVQELMKQLMSEELKELFKELEALMDKMDQDKLLEQLEKIDQNTEDMNEELDRSLELLKKMALEMKMEDAAKRLEELANKQMELANQKDSEAEKEAQEAINKEFEDLKEELDALEKDSKELKQDNGMEEVQKEAEDLKEKLEESLDQLNENKKEKANKSQKENAEKMQQMADAMKEGMESAQSEENAENIEDLKQILENLISVSFNQEDLYDNFSNTSTQNPQYTQYAIKQVNYIADFKIVEDSLNALAKRVAQIQPIIRKEITRVKSSMNEATEYLEERMTSKAQMQQRYAITSMNNLALLLDEVLQQLQKQEAQSKPGMSNCSKPKPGKGGKSSSLSKMRKAQEEMAKKLEEMMKKGKSKGNESGKGETGKKDGAGNSSEELVKMAAKQAAMRKQLREMAKELNKDGSGNGNGLNEIAKELEKIEEDLFNNNINPGSLLRQREILTKMLEEENADRTQEMDNQRKGENKNVDPTKNPAWDKYLEEKNKQIELLQTIPPRLNEYYDKKTQQYINAKP